MTSRNVLPYARLTAVLMARTYVKHRKNCYRKKNGCTWANKPFELILKKGCPFGASLFCGLSFTHERGMAAKHTLLPHILSLPFSRGEFRTPFYKKSSILILARENGELSIGISLK